MRGSDVEDQNPESREKQGDLEKPTDSEEKVDFDGENDEGDTMEEEVEYEEVEEEEEEQEEVEGEEEDEDGVEEETEGAGNRNVADIEDEHEKRKLADLLELPPHGSAVYLGGIPHNASEEDLRDFCQSVGDVFEVRIIRGKESGETKVYAFVTFKTKEMASKAIEKLNKSKFQGNEIKCSASKEKRRLFIGNIPRHWTEQDLRKAVTEIGPGVNSVALLKETKNSDRNRGFAFIEYYNHACAEYSWQKMSNPKFKLDDNAPTVKWAEPKNAESSAASQVKAVYVKNLPENITQDRLKELFEHHGKITKVVLPPAKAGHERSRFGFVYFAERSSAKKSLEDAEKYEIDGQVLECSFAKPQADQKSSRTPVSQNSIVLPTYPPQLGYGLFGGAYGASGSGCGAASFTQPLVYGRGAASAGIAMMPMLLPDGRIGYVLQQSGLQQHSGASPSRGGRRGGSSSGGRRGDDKNWSRYHPY